MAQSILFGYTVEEVDGQLVITVAGTMAAAILQDIAANVGSGRGGSATVPMMFPFSALASQAVHLMSPRELPSGEGKIDIKEIFGQGFDKNRSEFDAQLAQYRDLLNIDIARSSESSYVDDGGQTTSRDDSGKKAKKPRKAKKAKKAKKA